MFRISDLRNKDVVNSFDGKRLGFIKDIDLDLKEGKIKSLILPGESRLLGFLGKNEDVVIDWRQIKRIGVDVILVELPGFMDASGSQKEEESVILEKSPRKKGRIKSRPRYSQEDYYRQEQGFNEAFAKQYPPPKYEPPPYSPPLKSQDLPENSKYKPPYASTFEQDMFQPPKAETPWENPKAKAANTWKDSPLWHSPDKKTSEKEVKVMPSATKYRDKPFFNWDETPHWDEGPTEWNDAQDWLINDEFTGHTDKT